MNTETATCSAENVTTTSMPSKEERPMPQPSLTDTERKPTWTSTTERMRDSNQRPIISSEKQPPSACTERRTVSVFVVYSGSRKPIVVAGERSAVNDGILMIYGMNDEVLSVWNLKNIEGVTLEKKTILAAQNSQR